MPGSNVYISSGEATMGGAATTGATGGAVSGGASTAIPTSAYLGAGLGLLQAFNTYQQNSQIANTDSYEDLFTDFGNMDYTGDFNSLIKQRRSSYLSAVPSWRKIRLMNSRAKIGSAITSAGSGAMAGAGLGPWGIAAGALVGLGASLLGSSRADNEAKRKEAELNILRDKALEDNQRNFLAGVKNAEQQNNFLALSNIAAFGGPLDIGLFPVGGAIDYELAQRRLAQKDLELKKARGGPLHTHGADWTNGITIIDNGGSHESNPFEGVPMGIAPDGQPNLVEEGEVIFNDYVFSNRLRVPKAVREKYKLRGQKDMTFADAAKKAQKESEERPNDPISQRGLEDIMYKLMVEQETLREQRQSRKYAEGGGIHIKPSKRGTFTAAASKHDMGVQEFASKVLANPDDYSPAMRKKAQFAKNASKWKHAYGGIMGRMFEGDGDEPQSLVLLPNAKPLYPWLESTTPVVPAPKLTPMQQIARDKTAARTDGYTVNVTDNGTNFQLVAPVTKANDIDGVDGTRKRLGLSYDWGSRGLTGLRFVPAIGAGIGALTDILGITNRPDYSNADMIMEAARTSVGNMRDVSFTPVGNYLTYKPFDTLFYGNQLASQANATRRAIRNNSGGNRMTAIAGLLGADYNAQQQLGNLFRQAEEYNLAQRERVENFNRATNEFNSEGFLKAAMANAENAQKKATIRLSAAEKAAAIRDQVDARIGAARSANLTNLFNSLGDIGREAFTMNMVMSNPALYYSIGRDGTITYKNGFDELSEGEKAQVRRAAERASKKKACGGYLTIRRRR